MDSGLVTFAAALVSSLNRINQVFVAISRDRLPASRGFTASVSYRCRAFLVPLVVVVWERILGEVADGGVAITFCD